jgi:hypothetical protein
MNDSWLVQATTWVLTSWKIYTIAEWGAKGVFQISTKDCPQFQKIWWWANQICPAPNRNKKRTLGVPTTNWYESQLNNAKGEEERWNSSFSSYMYFHCSYLYSCYNSSGTLCIKCWVSYWVLIKLPYFADTTERGVRGWKVNLTDFPNMLHQLPLELFPWKPNKLKLLHQDCSCSR